MLKIDNSYIKFFVSLTPFGIITGPFFADLFISIASILFIFKSFEKNLNFYWKHTITKIFFIFYFYILLRSLLSSDILLSLESSLFYFRFGIFTLCVWYLCDNDKDYLYNFGKYFLAVFAFVILDALLQKTFGFNTMMNIASSDRLSGIFGDELILGSYLSRFMPLAFGFCILFSKSNRLIIPLFLIFLVILDIVIFYSGERTAFFYLILGSIVILLFSKNWKYLRVITMLVSLVLIVFITMYDNKIKDRMITQTLNQTGIANIISEDNAKQNSVIHEKFLKLNVFSPVHEPHLFSAKKMFDSNPLFGVGPKLFRVKCNEEIYSLPNGCSTHPHNTYFQLLAEIGLFGSSFVIVSFLFVLYLFGKHFTSMFTKKRYLNDFQICILTCILISLWPFAPSNNFFNNWISVVYYLPVGIFLSSIFNHSEKSHY